MTEYRLIRSDRRSLSLSIEPDGTVLVRAPRRLAKAEIDRFVQSHESWIAAHREKALRRAEFDEVHFSPHQLAELTARAKEYLPGRTAYWASRMGVTPTGIRVTQAKTRFGSCSAKDSISYSCRIMAFSPEAVDYVIVHELAHIRHKNHSREFYAFVARFLPDYRRLQSILRQRGEEEEV